MNGFPLQCGKLVPDGFFQRLQTIINLSGGPEQVSPLVHHPMVKAQKAAWGWVMAMEESSSSANQPSTLLAQTRPSYGLGR